MGTPANTREFDQRFSPLTPTRSQRSKAADLIAHARKCSPYYRALYHGLPDGIDDPRALPVTHKAELMAHFDDWVTDPAITLDRIRAFIDDPDQVGERFLGEYHVAVTSGTTGQHGYFVTDEATTAVSARINQRAKMSWLGMGSLLRLALRGLRLAAVTATGEHYGFLSGIRYMQRHRPFWNSRIEALSVHSPLPEIVARLNQFQPTLLMGYGSMIALLATEQEAGRLAVRPEFVEVMSERLLDGEFRRVGQVFGVRPYQMYGSTENPFAHSQCRCGWYHLNEEVAILEPIDADGQPTPPGEISHTVLLTNLVGRTQPILRYDQGDRITVRPDLCPCGDPRPAIQVQGRTADGLEWIGPDGKRISIPSLLLVTLIDRIRGVDQFQVEQTSASTLRIRLRFHPSLSPHDQEERWQVIVGQLNELCASRNLRHIRIERAGEPPVLSRGGKIRLVIPLARAPRA